MPMFCSQLAFFRCNLRKCSKECQALVDKSPLKLSKLALVIDTVHVRIHICAPDDYPLFVHYHKYQMGCKLKIITRNTLTEKVLESQNFLDVALRDFEILAKQLKVDFFPITCPEGWYLEQLKNAMTTTKVSAKKFVLHCNGDHTEAFKEWVDAEEVEHAVPISLEQM